ncbi:Retrovirus-related Pol polyprotein from transposon TNT 1-94 [Trichinella pseudospiralis]|uniref:Retrovirus-related Pol polyprotein from transposon TNT 1-94 n=1 Tax=Trichinella pseudospiralis TaxID=6337 RepID=A0A0V1KFV1_TRIPS|nr:Retrovirus-related Pol polyprotein from transposon TNT 1-94 [Trichinella pseudospiralis]
MEEYNGRTTHTKKTLIFNEYGCRIINFVVEFLRQHILSTATQYNGLYRLNQRVHWDMGVQDVPDLWHRRLRHLSHGSMKLLQDGQATGILSDAITETDCVTCLGGKQCRLATIKSEEALELVHLDICVPRQAASVGGARYFLSFIDDFLWKSFVYFLKHKNEALLKRANFKKLQTDNGRKYVTTCSQNFCPEKAFIRNRRFLQWHCRKDELNACGKGQNHVDRLQLEPIFVGRGCGHSQLLMKQMPHKGSAKLGTLKSLWLFGNGPRSLRTMKEVGSEIRRMDLHCVMQNQQRIPGVKLLKSRFPHTQACTSTVISPLYKVQNLQRRIQNLARTKKTTAQVSEQSNPISYKEAVNHPDANETGILSRKPIMGTCLNGSFISSNQSLLIFLIILKRHISTLLLSAYSDTQSTLKVQSSCRNGLKMHLPHILMLTGAMTEMIVAPFLDALCTMLHKEPYPSLQSEMENASLHCYAMIMEPLASAPISRRQQGQDPST